MPLSANILKFNDRKIGNIKYEVVKCKCTVFENQIVDGAQARVAPSYVGLNDLDFLYNSLRNLQYHSIVHLGKAQSLGK